MAFRAINESMESSKGYWGPVTATLDWCEANYQFSHYVAETANTWSNIATVGLALWGALQARAANLPSRYLTGYTGFAIVGLGSMFFHASLTYEAQLADELPMVYVATYCSAMLFDTEKGFSLRTVKSASLISAFVLFNILFTWSYAVYRNPVYHQVVFASIMFINAFRTVYLLNYSQHAQSIPDAKKAAVTRTFMSGASIFALGFFVWNLDNIFCNTVTEWKTSLGWPAAFLLEGHSWWHVFTATGTYLMLLGNTYLTLCIKDHHSKYALDYSSVIPTIARSGAKKIKSL